MDSVATMTTFAATMTAFAAGFLSFVSPCVLPLVPAYLSFISGLSLDEIKGAENRRQNLLRVLVRVIGFILGFSTIFVLLGATATFIGQFLLSQMVIISKIAGAVIIILGLHMAHLFRIPFLDVEKRFQGGKRPVGPLGAFVVGMAFAFGWTPCIGPILAGILMLASTSETVWKGIFLLFVYSMGLGLPFLLTGIGINTFFSAFGWIKKHFRAIEIVSGALLIIVGLLIFTNRFQMLAGFLMRYSQ